jgi:hypothetical protein
MISPKFFGSNVLWWMGVVEENDDSKAADGLKLGRCRVRIMGLHSPQLQESDETGEGIAVNQLRWAYPITPITSASMNGIGDTPLGPVKGSTVIGMSMDGAASQDLYIFGTVGGIPTKRRNPDAEGFCDPSGEYPKWLGEPDTNRLARAESDVKDNTCINTRRINLITSDIAGGGKWKEPESSYAAKYPMNKVRESESGHVEEWDDTPNAERWHRWHPKGCYTEVDANGNEIHKVIGDSFEIVVNNKNVAIKGNLNITVDGNANILVKGDALTEVEGTATIKAFDDLHLDAEGNMLITSQKSITVTAADDFIMATGAGNTQISLGAVQIQGSNTTPAKVASGIM